MTDYEDLSIADKEMAAMHEELMELCWESMRIMNWPSLKAFFKTSEPDEKEIIFLVMAEAMNLTDKAAAEEFVKHVAGNQKKRTRAQGKSVDN